MVGVNVPIPVPMAFHPFGAWKSDGGGSGGDASLFGGHHMHPPEGVRSTPGGKRSPTAGRPACAARLSSSCHDGVMEWPRPVEGTHTPRLRPAKRHD